MLGGPRLPSLVLTLESKLYGFSRDQDIKSLSHCQAGGCSRKYQCCGRGDGTLGCLEVGRMCHLSPPLLCCYKIFITRSARSVARTGGLLQMDASKNNTISHQSIAYNNIHKNNKGRFKKKLPNIRHCPNHGAGGLSKHQLFSSMNVWTYL